MEQSTIIDASGGGEPITILYTNWRGETAVRRIKINFIAYGNEALGFGWGSTEWHPEEQMMLGAWDVDKGAHRTFALAGIKAWGQEAVDIALASAPPAPTPEAGASASINEAVAKWTLSEETREHLAEIDRATIAAPLSGFAPYTPITVGSSTVRPDPTPEAGSDWRDDPSADERWNAGLDFGMQQFCAKLGVDPQEVRWDAATETVDGDVRSVIGNILTLWAGDDWQDAPGRLSVSPPPAEDLAGQGEPISEASLHAAMDAFYLGEDWRNDLGCALESSLRGMKSALLAGMKAAPAPSRPAGREVDDLIEAARELFGYASYAEIVGGVLVNRPEIRKWCDKTVEAIHKLEALRDPPRDGGDGWRPMETAPKNQRVLIYCVHPSGGCDQTAMAYQSALDGLWLTMPDERLVDFGPTHWRPLPVPPNQVL